VSFGVVIIILSVCFFRIRGQAWLVGLLSGGGVSLALLRF
jgi:hypothetical protein